MELILLGETTDSKAVAENIQDEGQKVKRCKNNKQIYVVRGMAEDTGTQ